MILSYINDIMKSIFGAKEVDASHILTPPHDDVTLQYKISNIECDEIILLTFTSPDIVRQKFIININGSATIDNRHTKIFTSLMFENINRRATVLTPFVDNECADIKLYFHVHEIEEGLWALRFNIADEKRLCRYPNIELLLLKVNLYSFSCREVIYINKKI